MSEDKNLINAIINELHDYYDNMVSRNTWVNEEGYAQKIIEIVKEHQNKKDNERKQTKRNKPLY